MQIIKQGAEALIYSDTIDGQKVLVKERIKKRYRISTIDQRLRATRTRQEMKLMREARSNGVMTPKIISSDEKSYKIFMEDINGELVKDFLEGKNNFEKVCLEIGREVGKLHSAGIIHGDLTTSNMMISRGKVFFIDFGLGQFSKRTEDMATDLSVLRETLQATHNKVEKKCWKIIARGYAEENKKHDEVFKRLEELESRGRYRDRSS